MEIGKFFDALELAVMDAWYDASSVEGRKMAEGFKEDLIKRIKTQAYPWKPLSPKYAKRKAKYKYDPRILIATGEYLKNIVIIQEVGFADTPVKSLDGSSTGPTHYIKEPRQIRFTIKPSNAKVNPSKLNPRPRITYEQLAKIHEHGSVSRKIPARPHFAPAIKEFTSKASEHAAHIQTAFSKRLEAALNHILSRP
jgi:hypothetical protein